MDIASKIKALVEYTIHLHEEYDDPEGYFATGDDELDGKICRDIRESAESNQWAWCVVEVKANYEGIFGNDFLGACNYASEKDFRESGYFDNMKAQALDELCKKLEKLQIK